MKRKIAFSGYGNDFFGFSFDDNFLIDILKERYEIEICDVKKADFVFCGIWGNPYEYCNVNQVRIMVQGENYIPDFNYIDYAISAYPLVLGDRNYFIPCGVESLIVQNYSHFLELQKQQEDNMIYDNKWLNKKEFFCNFLIGHDSEYALRSKVFNELSKYKRIESAGTFLNNMPNNEYVSWRDESKIDFQKKCKFTICFESTSHEGFITEKIVDAFISGTIPIYYGSNIVDDIFNKDAFLNLADYESIESFVERIIEIDNNDEEFLKMINAPKLIDKELPTKIVGGAKEFLYHIFDQDPKKAYRRSLVYSPIIMNDFCMWASEKYPLYQRKIQRNHKRKISLANRAKSNVVKIFGVERYNKLKSIIK